MKEQSTPPTDIRQQRSAWFKERVKAGMTTEEVFRLNDEAIHLFPPTKEERQEKFERLKAIPEFVL
jgi:hypothetical protein